MTDDAELLRRFAGDGSQAAFGEFVRRHIDLVYGAAVRRTNGDAHAAADITQQVFISTARDARKLAAHPVLAAWLHTATRNFALNHMISEQRRRTRELEAAARDEANRDAPDAASWGQLRPLLDSAIDELAEPDRAAVILRFLERRSYAEVGAKLNVSVDAARVRTDRAIDKLRAALERRGVTSSSAALAAIVVAQPAIAAPVGLAGTVTAAAILGSSAAPFAGFFISTMTAKSFTIGAATALIFFVGGLYVGSNRSPVDEVSPVPTNPAVAGLPDDNNRLQAELAAARAEAARLAEANTRLESRVAQLVDAPPPEPVSIGMSRGEVQQAVLNNLRQIHAARTQYVKEHNASPERVHELVGRTAYIKRIPNVAGENYANVPMAADQPMTVKTPDGLIITYDPAGEKTTPIEFTPEELKQREVEEQQRRISASAMKAMEAYRAAHAGERPPNEQALIPFFASPKEGADFVEMLEAQKALKR